MSYGAGGATDFQARIVTMMSGEEDFLGQPMVIINKPGAGGRVGWNWLATEAEADGYTLGVYNIPHFIAQSIEGGVKYSADSFEPIANWGTDPAVVIVPKDSPYNTIQELISRIDAKLSEQVNKIIHHEDFQQLESAWRGLSYMVNNTETDESLKIKVMSISKTELHKTLKKYKGTAWDQSPIFKKLYEEEYGQFGGEPYGCLVADYYFDHSPPDIEILQGVMQISSAAHAI